MMYISARNLSLLTFREITYVNVSDMLHNDHLIFSRPWQLSEAQSPGLWSEKSKLNLDIQ